MASADSTKRILHVGYSVELQIPPGDALVLQQAGISDLELLDMASPAPFFAVMFYKKTYRRSPATLVDQRTMHAWYLKRAGRPKIGFVDTIYVLRKRGVLQMCVCELSLDGAVHYAVLKNSKGRPMDDKRWANAHQEHKATLSKRIQVVCSAYEH